MKISDHRTRNGAYRTNVAPLPKKISFSFEERVIQARMKIPGPFRRLLSVITFIPITCFCFCVPYILMPIFWIVTGDAHAILDKTPSSIDFKCYDTTFVLRGFTALYAEPTAAAIFYREIREGKITRITAKT